MSASSDDIDRLAARFYGFFDNRNGHVPEIGLAEALFLPEARIFHRSPAGLQVWSLPAFLEPRIAWLSDGTLQDFHEWETSAQTVVFGSMASRFSEYRKQGRRDGQPLDGGGRKLIHLCLTADGWRIASLLWEEA